MWGNKPIYPYYNDDNDYNTNAPSFYDYLAKNRHLLKELVNKIWEYDKELAKRFEEWDKNIAELPENLEALLIQWMQDDTLATIINETIFSWKVDLTEFREFQETNNAFHKYVEGRLNNAKVSDINTNLGKIPVSLLSDEVISMMNGDTPVNVTPAEKSITSDKLADKSVDYFKLSDLIQKYFSQRVRFIMGRPDSLFSKIAITSDLFSLEKGDKIKVPTGYNWTLYHTTIETFELGWFTGELTMTKDAPGVKLVIRKDSSAEFTAEEVENFNRNVEIIRKDTLIHNDTIAEVVSKSLNNNPRYLTLTGKGGVSADDGTNTGASIPTRRNIIHYKLKKGEKITLTNTEDYSMAIWTEDTVGTYVDGWNTVEYIAPKNITVSLMIAKGENNNEEITDNEIIGLITIKNTDQLATYGDVVNVNKGVSSGGLNTVYVSLDGSDRNNGTSINTGFASLQAAIEAIDGNGTVIIERGVYHNQTINYTIGDLTLLAYENAYKANSSKRQLVEFKGSDTLKNWSSYENIYRKTYSENTRFNQVFIDKSLPIETETSRPSYNAVLWEGNNEIDDYKMKPVLTLAECQNEVGTFYYDGTYVYVNPQDITNEFNAVKTENGLKLSGNNLEMQDIVFDFYTAMPMDLRNIKNLNTQNCKANHSSNSNGWGLDYTNGTLTNCTGAKNRNDGFNMHYYGTTTLIDCNGVNNYDDGVSHHEQCKGTIIGGRYTGNGKGGVIPINDAVVNVYNAAIEDNYYGFYTEKGNAISQGNFYKGNKFAIVNKDTEKVKSINDTFIGNTNTDFTVNNVTTYGENVL